MPRLSLARHHGNVVATCWRLGEQLSDLSVNVAKEVHVGSAAVHAFVLHQELTEQHLRFVPLSHDLELRGAETKGNQVWCHFRTMDFVLVFTYYVHQRETEQTCGKRRSPSWSLVSFLQGR